MKLYAGTTEQFGADARMHRIAEKLRAEYTTQIELEQWSDGSIGPSPASRSNVLVTDIAFSEILPTSAGNGG